MEIIVGLLKLHVEDYGGGYISKAERDTYICITVQGSTVKVKASELKAAIEALEKTCWRA